MIVAINSFEEYRAFIQDISRDPLFCDPHFTDDPDNLYGSLHRTDTYWTAERVLSAPERFRVFLAVEDRQLLGYLDVTYGCDINEPYDLLVRPGLPFRKYAVPLLAEAVRRNGPNRMMALVYTDAAEEIAAYAASGFEKVEGQNSVYASYLL